MALISSIDPKIYFLGKLPEKPLDPALLGFLRVLCLNNEDVEHFKANIDQVKNLILPESGYKPELDQRVFKYLETRCDLLLKSYPTNLLEDLDLLKREDLSQKQYFCYLLRSKEKEMLQGAIDYCKSAVHSVEM